MTRIILISTLMLGPASISLGESRQWTDQSGNTMRAEFTGVIDGRVVLKVGSKRQPFALTDFSLDGRDYIREQLVKRRQQQKLAELMQSVPSVRRVSSVPGAPDTDTPTEVYGLQVPSPPLLQPESPREWTDLLDRKVTASFERLVAPAHLQLRGASGRSQPFAMVNLVRADLDYVKDVIKADWERDVFPPNSADMTEEQRRGGYRTWTDRKGEQLAAKFVRRASADLILSFDDEEHTFPFHAVSQGDQQWVGDELKCRSDAADARAATAPAPNPSPSSFPGGTPYGNDIGGRSGIYNWYGDGIVPVRIPV